MARNTQIKLPNPIYFQASQCSVWLFAGNGKYKEIVYKKVRTGNTVTWQESK